MHDRGEEQFENYLRSFRPIDPEALPAAIPAYGATAPRRGIAIAFAATVCVIAAALLLITLPNARLATHRVVSEPPSEASRTNISTPTLTRLALDEHDAFAECMTEKARLQFPPMRSDESTLRVLAKE